MLVNCVAELYARAGQLVQGYRVVYNQFYTEALKGRTATAPTVNQFIVDKNLQDYEKIGDLVESYGAYLWRKKRLI